MACVAHALVLCGVYCVRCVAYHEVYLVDVSCVMRYALCGECRVL